MKKEKHVSTKERPVSTKEKGFTLIELLVVISIIGILSVITLAVLTTARQKARDARRRVDLAQLSKSLDIYFLDKKTVPVDLATLVADGQYWKGNQPTDPLQKTDTSYDNDAAGEIPSDYETALSADATGSADAYCIWTEMENANADDLSPSNRWYLYGGNYNKTPTNPVWDIDPLTDGC